MVTLQGCTFTGNSDGDSGVADDIFNWGNDGSGIASLTVTDLWGNSGANDSPLDTYPSTPLYYSYPRFYPTLTPTSQPTLPPTLQPTFLPSSLPSPTPTEACQLGEEFDAVKMACVACPAGKHGEAIEMGVDDDQLGKRNVTFTCVVCSEGRFAAKNGSASCQECPAGTYNDKDALDESDHDSESDCTACPAGELSNGQRTKCSSCTAGQYTLNDTE